MFYNFPLWLTLFIDLWFLFIFSLLITSLNVWWSEYTKLFQTFEIYTFIMTNFGKCSTCTWHRCVLCQHLVQYSVHVYIYQSCCSGSISSLIDMPAYCNSYWEKYDYFVDWFIFPYNFVYFGLHKFKSYAINSYKFLFSYKLTISS